LTQKNQRKIRKIFQKIENFWINICDQAFVKPADQFAHQTLFVPSFLPVVVQTSNGHVTPLLKNLQTPFYSLHLVGKWLIRSRKPVSVMGGFMESFLTSKSDEWSD
jgi:hypothetical protein